MLQPSRISDNLPEEISEKGNNSPRLQLFVVYLLILESHIPTLFKNVSP